MTRRWSRRLLVALSLVVIVLAPVACDGSGSTLRGMARSESRAPVRDFAERRAVRVRHGPARAAVGAGAVWVTTARGVARVGTHSLRVSGPQLVLGHRPPDIAFAFGRLWVIDGLRGEVLGVNPRGGRIEVRASAPRVRRLAVGEGAVWATTASGRLSRIDRSGAVTDGPSGLPADGSVTGLAAGLGAIWVDESGVVYALAPRTGGTVERRIDLRSDAGAVAVGFGAVWVATGTEGDAVTRIDATNGSTHRIHVQASAYPDGVAIGRRSVWVLSSNRGALYRVDPRRLRRVGAPLSIGDLADGLAAGAGAVWLPHRHDDTVSVVRGTRRYSARPRRGGRIDELAGTYRGVGIGDRPGRIRRALGPGGHWGPHDPVVPLDADFLRLGNGADFSFDTLRIVPPDRRALRYRDAFFYPCGRRLHCPGRVGGFQVTGPGARTNRGVRIGEPLAEARRRYRLRCEMGAPNSDPSIFPSCTGRVAARRYIFFDNDPIDSIALAAAPWR